MKKLFLISTFMLAAFASTGTAHAAAGSSCTLDSDCSADAPYCNFTTFTCQAAPTSGTSTAPGSTAAGGSGTNATGFVPLAPIPGLTDVSGNISATTLTAFLNNLYKYLIGIAAMLAVIQIVRGGLYIMGQESVTKHGEGRHMIEQAVLGLVLVLSPVLVFTIINPAILDLSLSLPPLNVESAGNTKSSTTLDTTASTSSTVIVPGGTSIISFGTGACTNNNCSGAYAAQISNGCSVSDIVEFCETAQTMAQYGNSINSIPTADQVPKAVGLNINRASPGCPTGQTPIVVCSVITAGAN